MKPEDNIFGKMYGYYCGIKSNQLKFIADYKIARVESIFDVTGMDVLPDFMTKRKIFDHWHLFSTTDSKYVLITAPYSGGNPEDYGLIEIYPLYSKATKTYVKVFEDRADLRDYLS